ncbi:sterile alpha and TIR motif-containing protein 1-like isoform X2 [Myzus persicae]|nr:sterile alpha and TIR motif-containing protein 1-like isoform X2 [Myzus persicae]
MMERVEHLLDIEFDDLDLLRVVAYNAVDVENAVQKYSTYLEHTVTSLIFHDFAHLRAPYELIDKMFDMICKAWAVPNCKLGYELCKTLRDSGGLDFLMDNCMSRDKTLQSSSARLLEQCLTTENHEYILEKGVEKLLRIVCEYKNQISSVDKLNDSTGFLKNLFKHSEIMYSDVIKLGCLDVLLYECWNQDSETLKHCASDLANLSLYGRPESQDKMIKRKVPTWLFALAFNTVDNLKYDALLAIVVLVTNRKLVKSNMASYSRIQVQKWLKRLVPVLSSTREEERNLSAFHFLEAENKKQLRLTSVFRVVDVIESLKKVNSSENPVASKLAAKTLMLIGEEVPHHHCSQEEVPQWSVNKVHKWVKQIDFSEFAEKFLENLVDGHILLDITEDNLKYDIGMQNGIMRKRFMRELDNLKETTDYSSKDSTGLQKFLKSISSKFVIYTYPMLSAGVNMNTIRNLTADQLVDDCRITNIIHQSCILKAIREMNLIESSLDKKITDVFISYRRSNGSELASLIKVNLEIRGYRVFIDVVKLENGHFGNNLVKHIRQAKNFVLVLTKSSLDRCVGDYECNDWVHKEIVTAMQNQLNIIPIAVDDFTWPEMLPYDMRDLQTYDVVHWSNDHDDSCIDAIVTTIHGDSNAVKGETSDGLCQTCLPQWGTQPQLSCSFNSPNIKGQPTSGDRLPPPAT